MEHTFLVQRLKQPAGYNPHSFGGGLKNGGLQDEAMEILSEVFSFDYMGCAEYEFGALPEGLTKIFDNKDKLVSNSFKVHWEGVSFEGGKQEGGIAVYYLCQKDHEKEVKKFISKCAKGSDNTKGGTHFGYSLASPSYGVIGWLELNNGFFFFTDYLMWKKICAVFDM